LAVWINTSAAVVVLSLRLILLATDDWNDRCINSPACTAAVRQAVANPLKTTLVWRGEQ
jgi:hypothetical protein